MEKCGPKHFGLGRQEDLREPVSRELELVGLCFREVMERQDAASLAQVALLSWAIVLFVVFPL